MLKGRDIIIYLAIKYRGQWNEIYAAIKAKELVDEPTVMAALASLKCLVVTILDEAYPESLKKIYKPPFVLFYYGDMSLAHHMEQSLAIIGSRQASRYGITMTESIAKALIEEHITLISGLAKGIDKVAHEVAVNHQGRTIGILGSGIDHCYPYEHRELYEKMKKDHLVLSEYPSDVEPHKDHFPWRNRLIAGLSQGVFVAEAKKRSGTLITVGYALYLGKEVYVLPHLANSDNSTNRLIKDGAILVESAADVIEHLHLKHHEKENQVEA